MAKRLYVGNLPWSTTSKDLESLFSQAGEVESANVMMDTATGRSRGFGFVEMKTDEEGSVAVDKLNGYEIDGRKLTVNEARPRESRDSSGSSRYGA